MHKIQSIDDTNSIVITGGLTTKSQSGSEPYIDSNAVYIFNFETNTYNLHSKLSSSRFSHQSTTIGGNIYLIGGNRNDS